MKIELGNDCLIKSVPAGGYELQERYISTTKTGERVTRYKKRGYFRELRGALDAFLRINQEKEFKDLHTYLAHYADKVEESNWRAVEVMEKVIEDGNKDSEII